MRRKQCGVCALVVEGDERVAGIGWCKHGADERVQESAVAMAHPVHRALFRHQEALPRAPQRLHAPVEPLRQLVRSLFRLKTLIGMVLSQLHSSGHTPR